MRTRDQNYLTMAHTVNDVVKRYQSKWINIQRFAQSAEELNDLVRFITDANASADSNITGAALDKAAICIKAADEGLKLAKRTRAYARDKKNQELALRLTISRSKLLEKHDAEILATLKDWDKKITPIIGDLAPYGILPADLYYLRKLIDEFNMLLTKPRELIIIRKSMNTRTLPVFLKKTSEVLQQMDDLINLFEGTPFETEYINARKVIQLGSHRKKPKEDEEKPEKGDEKPEPPVA